EPLELKVHGDELADHLVVVDDQNASQWLGHGSKLADSHPTRTANAHVRVTPPTLVTFYRAARGAQGPLSSGDRATASGAVCAGSNPAGGTSERSAGSRPRPAETGSSHSWTRRHQAPPRHAVCHGARSFCVLERAQARHTGSRCALAVEASRPWQPQPGSLPT